MAEKGLGQGSLTGGPRSWSGPRSCPIRTRTYSQDRRLWFKTWRGASILTGTAFVVFTVDSEGWEDEMWNRKGEILKLSNLFEHFIYFLLFSNAALFYLVDEIIIITLNISAVIHICSVLCYMTINIVKKFLNCTEFIWFDSQVLITCRCW